jgi:hypothetical protein
MTASPATATVVVLLMWPLLLMCKDTMQQLQGHTTLGVQLL